MSNSKSATTFDDLPLILNVNDVASILAIIQRQQILFFFR